MTVDYKKPSSLSGLSHTGSELYSETLNLLRKYCPSVKIQSAIGLEAIFLLPSDNRSRSVGTSEFLYKDLFGFGIVLCFILSICVMKTLISN